MRATRKLRLLCLHGWRTSGKILTMQSAAMRFHTEIEMVTVDAPWSADGPPDPMIGQIYKDMPYFQWYYRYEGENGPRIEGLEESLNYLVNIFRTTGPYDGLLGFSQGAAMATLLADRLLQDVDSLSLTLPKFAVLIGGIQPVEQYMPKEPIDLPSLHIIGRSDYLQERSHALTKCFRSDPDKELSHSESKLVAEKRTTLYHQEGHQIPSVRTELYPDIKQWMEQHS